MKRTAPTLVENIKALSTMVSRAAIFSHLGISFGGERDLYTALGYPKAVSFEMYMARYKRQDISKRIINAYPEACWAKPPKIEETQEGKSPFETKWEELVEKTSLWHYLERLDRISGIGQYGVLLIGFNDGLKLEKPVGKAKDVLYLRPFMQNETSILTWEGNPTNPRYGLPKEYNLQVSQPPLTGSNISSKVTLKVHHSRVLHVADGLTTDDIYGEPRLEAVYNRLQDLEMIAGGGAEMWWRGAFPGLGLLAKEGAAFDPTMINELQDEIDDYIHGLKRYMRLQNIDLKQLTPTLADSTKPFEVEITLISVATGIPKRILMGTERGELASSQDTSEWDDRVDRRRQNFCAPKIIKPFINACINAGVLPQPSKYSIVWSPIHIMNEKEKTEITVKRSEAISKYAGTMGADQVVPPKFFLTEIMGFSEEKAELIWKEAQKVIAEEEKRMEEERKVLEQIAPSNGGNGGTKPAV